MAFTSFAILTGAFPTCARPHAKVHCTRRHSYGKEIFSWLVNAACNTPLHHARGRFVTQQETTAELETLADIVCSTGKKRHAAEFKAALQMQLQKDCKIGAHSHCIAGCGNKQDVRVRVTGSRPAKGMPVLSAARQCRTSPVRTNHIHGVCGAHADAPGHGAEQPAQSTNHHGQAVALASALLHGYGHRARGFPLL
eukprot:355021-Chlamydomonas_euryale.AAC.14